MKPALPTLVALASLAALEAQDQGRAQGLASSVESYLRAPDDGDAARLLDEILAREDATPEALIDAVRTPPPIVEGRSRFQLVHDGEVWEAEMWVPEGHTHDAAPLPTLLDISRGTVVALTDLKSAIWVMLPQYKPEQFSETGRDGFMKAVRTAAFRANGGDLWLGGYSWAGHASYGTAMHRPGFLRGIVPSGGGPRRSWFRLKANLEGLRILSFCGEQDDPELVWNLREFPLDTVGRGLDYHLWLDPREGHIPQLQGFDQVPTWVFDAPPREPATEGTLYVDGPAVENPWIRCLEVKESAVSLPQRIPVSVRLDADGQRRATLAAMAKKVATVRWSLETEGDTTTLTIRPRSVTRLQAFLHLEDLSLGRQVEVRRGSKRVFAGEAAIDRRVLLEEARRTGERRNPTILRVEL